MVNIEIIDIAHHRNGVSGNGFYAVLFRHLDEEPARTFIATVFDEPGSCAVLDVDMAAQGIVTFTQNSWRGDYFEPTLREEIKRWEGARDREFAQRMRRG